MGDCNSVYFGIMPKKKFWFFQDLELWSLHSVANSLPCADEPWLLLAQADSFLSLLRQMRFILDIKPVLNTQNNSIWAKLFAWHLLAECRKTPVYWFVTYKIFYQITSDMTVMWSKVKTSSTYYKWTVFLKSFKVLCNKCSSFELCHEMSPWISSDIENNEYEKIILD